MAANLVFDPSQFENLIDKYGIKKAWRNILATHIVSFGDKFLYILEDQIFKGYKLHSENLLDKLSIGEVGVLYEYCVAHVDASSRKDNGQFFTPDDVAVLMCVRSQTRRRDGDWYRFCFGL